jgi:hypothetical protein
MALQLVKIETVEVASNAASVTFSNIPQGYTDLKLVYSARVSSTTPDTTINFNGVTTNLADKVLYSYNGSIGSNSTTTIRATTNMSTQTSNVFGSTDIYIPNYTLARYKAVSVESVAESNETSNAYIYLTAGLWSSTAAITSITLTPYTSNFYVANSTFTLYGVI